MADTPPEGGDQPAAPKRTRRPRAAAEGSTPKPRARRTPKAAQPETTTEKVKRTAKSAVDGTTRAATRAEKAVTRAAKTTRTKVEKAATPVANRKVAIGAAAAVGVAAGLAAAVIGRRKITQTATDVIDSVTGTVSEVKKGSPEANPPAPSAD